MSATPLLPLSFGLVVASTASTSEPASGPAPIDALADWLRANAKLDLVSRPVPTYKELVASIREGSSDVAWLPPVAYAWLAEGVTPIGSIVRGGATTYGAALVVREDSAIQALSDLKGVRAGWVDPWSAAGYVVPRLELVRAKIDPQEAFASETFYGGHREALLALGREECDVVGTYARLPDEGENAVEAAVGAWTDMELPMRVLAAFGSIPTDVIAVRRNLGPKDHERVVSAFREACRDDVARALLQAVFGGDAMNEGLEPGHEELRRAYERALANGLFD